MLNEYEAKMAELKMTVEQSGDNEVIKQIQMGQVESYGTWLHFTYLLPYILISISVVLIIIGLVWYEKYLKKKGKR